MVSNCSHSDLINASYHPISLTIDLLIIFRWVNLELDNKDQQLRGKFNTIIDKVPETRINLASISNTHLKAARTCRDSSHSLTNSIRWLTSSKLSSKAKLTMNIMLTNRFFEWQQIAFQTLQVFIKTAVFLLQFSSNHMASCPQENRFHIQTSMARQLCVAENVVPTLTHSSSSSTMEVDGFATSARSTTTLRLTTTLL